MQQCIASLKDGILLLWISVWSFLRIFIPKRFLFKDVRGKVVLITGGGSGFGRILAQKFAIDHGCVVVIWDVNNDGLEETAKIVETGGGKCYQYVVDVSNREAVYKSAEKVRNDVGIVYMLINNAGIGGGELLLDCQDEIIERVYKINTSAHYWTVKAFLPNMVSQKEGHIVTISSVSGLFGTPRMTHYSGCKFAAVGFHEAITAEIKFEYPETKIDTTVICPFYTRTPLIAGVEKDIKSSFLFPIREAEPVVQEMVEGILVNDDMLITSFGPRALFFFKAMIPSKVMKTLRSSWTTRRVPISSREEQSC